MPHHICHLCGEEFLTTTSLTQHVQQRKSKCTRSRSFNEFVSIAEALELNRHLQQSYQPSIPRSSSPRSPSPRPPSPCCPSPPPPSPPPSSDAPTNDNTNGDTLPRPFRIKKHPKAGIASPSDENFMSRFDDDWFAEERQKNLYYPFASKMEWELAFFLIRSRLSTALIDEFLALPLIRLLNLSFKTAKTLRAWIEILPPGPQWNFRPMTLHPNYPMKKTVSLYYRDLLECIESLMQNPIICGYLSYTPIQVYRSAANMMRVYSHWLTGTHAWDLQDQLPENASLLGVVLSSDKTQLTAMTGGRSAYPLLISLANLDFDFRNKATNNAFLLLALLPVPKFVEPNADLQGTLVSRLIHRSFDIVLKPLKIAAEIGIMLTDAFGRSRYSFTPLAVDIVDLPEAHLMSCISAAASPVTLATKKQFGDDKQYAARTRHNTLSQLRKLNSTTDPWNLQEYVRNAKLVHLSGVHKPFWRDWPLSEPSLFLTPEPLHHWFKSFYDHDLKWCINGVGAAEFDFRFSILPVHSGFRRFPEGVSKLKQVTGREQRNIMRYIVAVIAGAVPASFTLAIRSLVDFRYRGQAPELDENDLQYIQTSLHTFHDNKQSIIDARARLGKKNNVIDKWEIPKLEMLQSVVSSTRASGVAIQWSADTTEHRHSSLIKDPARRTNNHGVESQICRRLDLEEKCRLFDLSTSIRARNLVLGSKKKESGDSDEEDSEDEGDAREGRVSTTEELIDATSGSHHAVRHTRNRNYFAHTIEIREDPSIKPPYCSLSSGFTAIHLKRKPCYSAKPIDEVATLFKITDLRAALSRYLQRAATNESGVFVIGGPRRQRLVPLPFNLRIWTRCQIQNKSIHYPHGVLPASTIYAQPPKAPWDGGRMDPVIVNTSVSKEWPKDRLDGHCVAQLCLIMQAIPHDGEELPNGFEPFLVYVRRFNIIPQLNPDVSPTRGPYPEHITSLYVLSRAVGAADIPIGDIIPLAQLCASVDLIPKFDKEATRTLTRETSLAYSSQFYLNKYFTKELFFALS